MTSQVKVFLGIPHLGTVVTEILSSLMTASPSQRCQVVIGSHRSSLLAANFNALWCAALNGRSTTGFSHFAMLHADTAPAAGWLDTLLSELEAHDLDVVSVVSPIKDP